MSEKSSINTLLEGLSNRLSYQIRKERLLNNLRTALIFNYQTPIRIQNLHPPPNPSNYTTNLNESPNIDQNQFVENNNQDNTVCSNLGSLREAMLIELERLREIMSGDFLEDDENYINLSDYEKEIFHEFLEYFSACPICNRRNHKNYLKTFYFDENIYKRILKERLLKLMDEAKEFDESYFNKILLGIPCCDCFKRYFCEF